MVEMMMKKHLSRKNPWTFQKKVLLMIKKLNLDVLKFNYLIAVIIYHPTDIADFQDFFISQTRCFFLNENTYVFVGFQKILWKEITGHMKSKRKLGTFKIYKDLFWSFFPYTVLLINSLQVTTTLIIRRQQKMIGNLAKL